jgi:ABC-type uncharacterized transport system substrate-binding protein
VEYRSADGQYSRRSALIEDVFRINPELILSSQTPTTQAIRKLTATVPIVMVGHGDPVRYGLVTNLARPENNIIGVSFLADELGIKVLELLKEAAPKVVRVAVLINRDNACRFGRSPFVPASSHARISPRRCQSYPVTGRYLAMKRLASSKLCFAASSA